MRQGSRLLLNSSLTTMARVAGLVSRLIIVPFAIGILGQENYGIWVVVGGLLAYAPLLELGMRAAVSRQTALRHARGEEAELNVYLNTAGAFYLLVAGVFVGLTVLVSAFFTTWFAVDPRYHAAARIMVLCGGGTLALAIAQYPFSAYLAGRQRYEIDAATEIGMRAIQLVLVLALLPRLDVGDGLILLALAMGGAQVIRSASMTVAALVIGRRLRYRPWRLDRVRWREMVTYGINSSLYMLAALGTAQLAAALVGALRSTGDATDFRVALELIIGVHAFVIAATVILEPAASRYFGLQDEKMLRELLVRSTRYAGAFSLTGLCGLLVFADTFLQLWQGGNYPGPEGAALLGDIANTARVLAVGYALYWLMAPGFNVLQGMARNAVPARLAMGASLTGLLLLGVLAARPGARLDHAAWGLALPMLPVWGLILPVYCCRAVGLRVMRYLWQGLLVPALCVAPALIGGSVLVHLVPATRWEVFVGQLLLFGALLLPTLWWGVLVAEDRARLLGVLRRRSVDSTDESALEDNDDG